MSKKKLISELTPDQLAKVPEYVERFRKIGTKTGAIDKAKAEAAIVELYSFLGKKAPTIEWKRSPKEGLDHINALLSIGPVGRTAQIYRASWGSVEAFWVCLYAFINNELPVEQSPIIEPLVTLIENCGWMWNFENYVLCTELPTQLHFNAAQQLHRDLGPAIEYSDGFSVYALNGIRMKESYVMTPAAGLSVADVMQEQNVDIRRELLRKIGLERFVKESGGKVLDTMTVHYNNKDCVYQLLELNFGEVSGRVLKMDNPSIDAIHVEGVEDSCNTVKEALAWRLGLDSYIAPEQLT